jgi:hypothetical protein
MEGVAFRLKKTLKTLILCDSENNFVLALETRLPLRELRRDLQRRRAELRHKRAEVAGKLEVRVVPQVKQVDFVDFHGTSSFFSG